MANRFKQMLGFVSGLLLAVCQPLPALAQINACPQLSQQRVVIYFGNGINTTPRAARRSMEILRDSLGNTYNDKKLRYDTAYNATEGMALDLLQAVRQAGMQWDSEVANWLGRLDLAPEWFINWYRAEIEQRMFAYVPELDQHVESYRSDILLGSRVLVVAHSQGNFYVNQVKPLLAQGLDADKMRRFAIYGVAVPANNVGGANGPYLTNHRDVIQWVPDSLPVNFTLQRANGTSAEDVGQVTAHLFNDTYMSDVFNVKPVLLAGIKAELDKFESAPPAVCKEEVRAYLMGLVSGSYNCYANNKDGKEEKVGAAAVGKNGLISVQGQGAITQADGTPIAEALGAQATFDVTHPNVNFGMSFPTEQSSSLGFVALYENEVGYNPSTLMAIWNANNGIFNLAGASEPGRAVSCGGGSKPENIQHVKSPPPAGEVLANAMRILMGPKRFRFEAGECVDFHGLTQLKPKDLPAMDVNLAANGIWLNRDFVPWSPQQISVYQRIMTGSGSFLPAKDFEPRIAVEALSTTGVTFVVNAIRGFESFILYDRDSQVRMVCSNRNQ